jgi:hypothetical protein
MSILTANIPVPTSGDGPIVSVANMVGAKTVQLSGQFSGYYDLLGTHDGAQFVAVASFDSGGPEGIKVTVNGSFSAFRLRSKAQPLTVVVCEVSAVSGVGENGFGTIASIGAGFSGLTPIVDTSGFVSPDGSQVDTNFICRGDFEGAIVVLGSIDGSEFNPIGEFRVDRRPEGSPAVVELSPLLAGDNVRYVRLQVGRTTGPVVVTFGGRVPPSIVPATTVVMGNDCTGRSTSLNASGEEILYETTVDLNLIPQGQLLTPSFSGVISVSSASEGKFKLYIGSVSPGTTIGAQSLAEIATTSTSKEVKTAGGPFGPNPGGVQLLQITGINDTPGSCVSKMYSCDWRFQ